MLSKLKDIKVILIIVLILSLVTTCVFFFLFKGSMEEQIASKDLEIEGLQTDLAAIGELVPAYTVATDVVSGKQIEESDLVLIDVPLSMSTNLVQDSEELIGKHFKIGLTAGTVITVDTVYEEVITPDMRYYDVMLDVLPIGLQPGAYVDVRIKYGTGTDAIGISHRQVGQINGNVLKLILTEEDIQMFSSMLIDNIVAGTGFELKGVRDENEDGVVDKNDITRIQPMGAYLYAVQYVEGGAQSEAKNFYAPNRVTLALLQENPNINEMTLTPEELILKRQLILAGILSEDGHILEEFENQKYAVSLGQYVQTYIKEGITAYERRMEAELEQQRAEEM